ncbi:hypothetical protein SDC9_154100 [bioreactor metagenome]|uniref:Uncharacterized protein n=1 Tax=bioreactor metagenome TaxID=1076179 RepID=A0A645F2H1_9ZZZZ
MYVDPVPQVASYHGRALNVPARPSLPPGRVPGDLSGLGALPYGKIHLVSFHGVLGYPAGRFHIIKAPVGKAAVVLHLPDREVDAAVLRLVCEAVVHYLPDH